MKYYLMGLALLLATSTSFAAGGGANANSAKVGANSNVAVALITTYPLNFSEILAWVQKKNPGYYWSSFGGNCPAPSGTTFTAKATNSCQLGIKIPLKSGWTVQDKTNLVTSCNKTLEDYVTLTSYGGKVISTASRSW